MIRYGTSILYTNMTNLFKDSLKFGNKTFQFNSFNFESDEIPPDLINMFLLIVSVLIIILILILLFLALLFFWLKRQEKMNYPVKPKVIMQKERNLIKPELKLGTKLKEEQRVGLEPESQPQRKIQPLGTTTVSSVKIPEKFLKAKPVSDTPKSSKLATITSARVAHHRTIVSSAKPANADKTKPIAKPVQRISTAKPAATKINVDNDDELKDRKEHKEK